MLGLFDSHRLSWLNSEIEEIRLEIIGSVYLLVSDKQPFFGRDHIYGTEVDLVILQLDIDTPGVEIKRDIIGS